MLWGETPHWIGHAGEFWTDARLYLVAGSIVVLLTLVIVYVSVATSRSSAARQKGGGEQKLPDDPAQHAISCTRLREALLTPNELLFYRMLGPLVSPRCLLFAKVRLADLFEVGSGPGRGSAYRMLTGKRIDFVLCDPATSNVVAGVEMDENARETPDREDHQQFIDDLFASNGLPMLRVPLGGHEDLATVSGFLSAHELLPARAGSVSEPVGMI